MFRAALLALALTATAFSATAAPPRSGSITQPTSARSLKWEIVALPKGGKGKLQVLGTVTGTELRAQQERQSAQAKFPDFFIDYRLAR